MVKEMVKELFIIRMEILNVKQILIKFIIKKYICFDSDKY